MGFLHQSRCRRRICAYLHNPAPFFRSSAKHQISDKAPPLRLHWYGTSGRVLCFRSHGHQLWWNSLRMEQRHDDCLVRRFWHSLHPLCVAANVYVVYQGGKSYVPRPFPEDEGACPAFHSNGCEQCGSFCPDVFYPHLFPIHSGHRLAELGCETVGSHHRSHYCHHGQWRGLVENWLLPTLVPWREHSRIDWWRPAL
jgi:hypothetical protein